MAKEIKKDGDDLENKHNYAWQGIDVNTWVYLLVLMFFVPISITESSG